jgi:hypothetical protein
MAFTAFTLPASASMVSTSSDVTVLSSPPPSVQQNQLQSNTDVFFFQERNAFTLPLPLAVDTATPGTYGKGGVIPLPSDISAGTTVNSYYLSANPDLPVLPLGYALYSGSVTFGPGEKVIGLEFLDASLLLGAAEVGAPGTAYPPPPLGYGLEPGDDSVRLSADRGTVNFSFITGNGDDTGGEDQIRIITAVNAVTPAPEPANIVLMMSGTCCLVLARRKRI